MKAASGRLVGTGRCATVTLPGTCGEWVQGTLDGVPCLVSCPIDWYGTVSVEIQDGQQGAWQDIRVMPPGGAKVAAAVDLALSRAGAPVTAVVVRTRNPLPQARGYASSTVDVAGAILAVGEALGHPFPPAEVARLAVAVEPSDSIMFPGLALLAHRDASFYRPLSPAPGLAVVVIDPGGTVDTVAFNQADHSLALKALAPRHRVAFDLLMAGLASGDGRAVAEAGTISALAHQALLPNSLLEPALALARRAGALGVVRAHSGMLVGLVCEPESAPKITRLAQARFSTCTVLQHRCL